MSVIQHEDQPVSVLLDREKELALAKERKVKALLDERVTLAKATQDRLAAIGQELKSLGWHPVRSRKNAPVQGRVLIHGEGG